MKSLLLVPVLLIIFANKSHCIWNGNQIGKGNFSYIVTFRTPKGGHVGGKDRVEYVGNILSQQFILTSALCADRIPHYELYLWFGDTDITKPGIKLEIGKIIKHENNDKRTDANDIAVIQTKAKLELSPGKATIIKLPSRDHPENGGIEATVTGWDYILTEAI